MSSILYGSSGDVREELNNPSEREYSAPTINNARKKSTYLINSFLKGSFPDSIPFATTAAIPEQIFEIANDLSVYYARRKRHPGPLPLSDEIKTEYYEKSIELLKLIRDGELDIPELSTAKGDSIQANRESYNPVFDVDNITEQNIDETLLDDIADARD